MRIDTSLTIRINGEQRRLADGATIADMIVELGLDPKRVAVERNRAIVPRSTFAETAVADGDAFEIVHFVGGG